LKSTNRYQRDVVKFLAKKGLLVEDEYQVGMYSVDIFLPELGLGIEIDGPIHGLTKKRDFYRDLEIKMLEPRIREILRFPVNTPKEKIFQEVIKWWNQNLKE